MQNNDQRAQEWYLRACKSYVEKHQGCPWCQGANRLYQSQRGLVREFHCGSCEFFVCHDQITDRYFVGEGTVKEAPLTHIALESVAS
jgi:hypothetical protein